MSVHQAVDPYLTIKDVVDLTKVNPGTIYRWIDKGLFPAPVKLGVNCSRWRSSAIARWQQDLEKEVS